MSHIRLSTSRIIQHILLLLCHILYYTFLPLYQTFSFLHYAFLLFKLYVTHGFYLSMYNRAVRVTHSCYNSEHNNAYVTLSYSGKAKSSFICQMTTTGTNMTLYMLVTPSRYYSDLITFCHSVLQYF